jgi:hypothetical protein
MHAITSKHLLEERRLLLERSRLFIHSFIHPFIHTPIQQNRIKLMNTYKKRNAFFFQKSLDNLYITSRMRNEISNSWYRELT